MSKNIMVSDEAYNLLTDLKLDKEDSFTKVILRNLVRPGETGEELAAAFKGFVPRLDDEVFAAIRAGRGRRSNRPKK